MKKRKIMRFIGIILIGIIVLWLAALLFHTGYRYHTTGQIVLCYDGEQVPLEQVMVNNFFGSRHIWESSEIHNNKFQFKSGGYGENKFAFVISDEQVPGLTEDITINFSYYNTVYLVEKQLSLLLEITSLPDGNYNLRYTYTYDIPWVWKGIVGDYLWEGIEAATIKEDLVFTKEDTEISIPRVPVNKH